MEWPEERNYNPNIEAIIRDSENQDKNLYDQLTNHPLYTIKEEYIEDYLK